MSLTYEQLLTAVQKGDSKAQTKLAILKLTGTGGAEVDEEGAVSLLEESVHDGDDDAKWILGICCEFGFGIEQDLERARSLYCSNKSEIGRLLYSNLKNGTGKMSVGTPLCTSSSLSMEKIESLCKALMIAPWTSLDVDNRFFGDEETTMIVESLRNNSSITELSLAAHPWDWKTDAIGMKGLKLLSGFLIVNTSITKLNLDKNKMGNNGVEMISEALMVNTTLTMLSLKHNTISDDGASVISKSLKSNNTLTELILSHNNIENRGAELISKALMVNTTLTSLNLNGNKIGEEGVKMFSRALTVNTTLVLLDLWDNPIKEEGAGMLQRTMKNNTTLTSLNIDFDRSINVFFFGSAHTGLKESIVDRYCSNQFWDYKPRTTACVCMQSCQRTIDYIRYRLKCWYSPLFLSDFSSPRHYFFLQRGRADIVVVGFDVTRKKTLEECDVIIESIRQIVQESSLESSARPFIMVAVGNKIDLADKREVTKGFAQRHFALMDPPLLYFETSAKTGEGINEMFETAIRMWIELQLSQPPPETKTTEESFSKEEEESSSTDKSDSSPFFNRCIIA